MNRVGLGLAVGAGYLLGRTKKLKTAVAVGTLVAGKRMNLSPRAVTDLVSQQLRNNPQFKEIGDQLREDLRGVGKAASGAMVERQLDSVADRLHGRTAQMRDQLTGAVPGKGDTDAEDAEDEEPEDSGPEEDEEPEPALREAAKKAPGKKAPANKAYAKTAKKAPARKAPAKKTAGKKAEAKKTTAGRSAGSAARGARARLPKGGGEG